MIVGLSFRDVGFVSWESGVERGVVSGDRGFESGGGFCSVGEAGFRGVVAFGGDVVLGFSILLPVTVGVLVAPLLGLVWLLFSDTTCLILPNFKALLTIGLCSGLFALEVGPVLNLIRLLDEVGGRLNWKFDSPTMPLALARLIVS